ncbi:MAG: hypothetical protein FVQ77_04515 [Cytophagales bacterium]|nr:hypothetical protein [Cytophagales bacterium]
MSTRTRKHMNALMLKRFPIHLTPLDIFFKYYSRLKCYYYLTGLISFLFLISACPAQNSSSQIDPGAFGYYIDALRYSQTRFGGTARIQGMAGAQTALGADMSTLAGNPAGLGAFRHSIFSITPSLGFGNTESDFCTSANSCTTSTDTKSNFNISNIGIVFTNLSDDDSPGTWRAATYGISFTRLNNFHNRFIYEGVNKNNSMTDYFVEITNGIPVTELDQEFEQITSFQGLAYWTFLTNPDDLVNNTYYSFITGDTVSQQEIVETTGAQNQWDLAYGANYDDQLFVGASLGIASIRYIEKKEFREDVIADTIENLRYFVLNDYYKTIGTGINLKFGLIYRPSDLVRAGIFIQTPTYYSMTDDYQTDITAYFDNVSITSGYASIEQRSLEEGTFSYKLTTPYRLSGGVALFAGKKGFLSTDVEYVAYNSADLNGGGLTFQGDNKTIKKLYKPAVNLKVGGELRFEIFRVRAGFALYGDPYNNIDNVNRKRTYITGGVGMREKDYFLDIAFVTSKYNSAYTPYTLNDGSEPFATVKNSFTSLLFTFGTVF